MKSRNEIEIIDNKTAYILCRNGKILIDAEDIKKVEGRRWVLTNKGYGCCFIKNEKPILIHRFLMNCPSDKVIDHLNHIRNDNRKENLRICTYLENSQNTIKTMTKNIIKPCVDFYKGGQKWRARLKIFGEYKHVGYYPTEIEARKASRIALIKI